MKKIIISAFAAFLAFSTVAMADEKNDKVVEEAKHQWLQQIDKEVARLGQLRGKQDAIISQFKSCIQAMKNEADFKACVNARIESEKKFAIEQEKARLEEQKKAIANEEKRLEEMKVTPKK